MATDQYIPTIKDLPQDERPRERLYKYGATNLSNAELLAILMRVGTRDENAVQMGQRLISKYGLPGLARASFDELTHEKGLGLAKVAQIKAALELGRRLAAASPQERQVIRSPADAANLLMSEMQFLEQEQMRTVLLDTRNRVLRTHTVYVGSLNTAMVRIGELFRDAIRANCAALIVVHNHPSGDPTPSPEDVAVTRMIVEAGKLLDIDVLDHIVIGRKRYVSLKERGLGFD
jgi:DNA repair protein RadC